MTDAPEAVRTPMLETLVITVVDAESCRRGQKVFTLRPGVVDDDAVEYFGHLFCAHLAAAFHERFGWPLVVVRRADCVGRLSFAHMAVEAPDGRFVDVFGARPSAELMDPMPWFPHRVEMIDGFGSWFELVGMPADTSMSWWRERPYTVEPVRYGGLVFSLLEALWPAG